MPFVPLVPQTEAGVFEAKHCEKCGRVDGVEALWSQAEAAAMIPFAQEVDLRVWLSKHRDEFPSRIRVFGYKKIRVLTTSEILAIRKRVIYTRFGEPTDPAMQLVRMVTRDPNGPRYIKSPDRQRRNDAIAMLLGNETDKAKTEGEDSP